MYILSSSCLSTRAPDCPSGLLCMCVMPSYFAWLDRIVESRCGTKPMSRRQLLHGTIFLPKEWIATQQETLYAIWWEPLKLWQWFFQALSLLRKCTEERRERGSWGDSEAWLWLWQTMRHLICKETSNCSSKQQMSEHSSIDILFQHFCIFPIVYFACDVWHELCLLIKRHTAHTCILRDTIRHILAVSETMCISLKSLRYTHAHTHMRCPVLSWSHHS